MTLCATIDFKHKIQGVFTMQQQQGLLELAQGYDGPLELVVTDLADQSLVDLTGALIRFTVKRDAEDADDAAVIRKSSRSLGHHTDLLDSLGTETLRIEDLTAGLGVARIRVTVTAGSRYATTLAEDLVDGATEVDLADASEVAVGDVIEFDDAGIYVTVTAVDDNTISFAALALDATIDSGAQADERSFALTLESSEAATETYATCSLIEASEYYIVDLLADSDIAKASLLDSDSGAGKDLPAAVADVLLTGGELPIGGITITDAEAGVAEIQLDAADTATLPPRSYLYDVKVTLADGRIAFPARGTLRLRRAITLG